MASRVVFDATRVGCNKRIRVYESQEMPLIGDLKSIMSYKRSRSRTGLKIDFKRAFKNILANNESSWKMCFTTSEGWFRYKGLPFGMKSSSYFWGRTIGICH